MYNKRKKKTKYFFLTLTRKLKSSLSLCLTFKAWIIMYVHVHSKMKRKYGLTDLVTIQVLRLWEGKCHFGYVFSLKFLQRDPKKFIIQNLLDFFFLIFTKGPKKFIIQNFLDFFLNFEIKPILFLFTYKKSLVKFISIVKLVTVTSLLLVNC